MICGAVSLILPIHIDVLLFCRRGFQIRKVSLSCFEISELAIQGPVRRLVYVWNGGVKIMKSMAKGEDWGMFCKVSVVHDCHHLPFCAVELLFSCLVILKDGLMFNKSRPP